MGKAEILSLIDQDILTAFEELDKLFKKTNARYNDLSNEYLDKPIGSSLQDLRNRLKRFVSLNYEENKTPAKSCEKDIDFEEPLCDLNFKRQELHFKNIYKSKKVSAFLLYGEDESGSMDLKWLYHQLLRNENLLGDVPIKIDFSGNAHRSFDDLLNNFYNYFHIKDRKKQNLRAKIEDRLGSSDLIALVKYPKKISDVKGFYTLFYEFFSYLSNEVAPACKHSLIFLLVENNIEYSYKLQVGNYFLWFPEEPEAKFSLLIQECKEPKIIDLSPIEKLPAKRIEDWIEKWLYVPQVSTNLSCYLKNIDPLLKDSDAPYKVIQKIYEALKIENQKTPEQWLIH